MFNHLYLVGIKELTQELRNRLKSLGSSSFKWLYDTFPRSPKCWPWLSVTCSITLCILLNPRHWPCLPCSTGNVTNRKNDGSCLLPKQNHNFIGITDLSAGLLDSKARQSCIFLSLTPSLKQTLVKSQCNASTSFLMFQKEFNKFSLRACGAFGRCLDQISTSRQKPMHVFQFWRKYETLF